MTLDLQGARVVIGCPADGGGDAPGFVLDIARLRLRPGDMVAVTGRSGAGKTAVLEVAGLLRAPAAAACFTLNGVDVRAVALSRDADARARARRDCIIFVPQSGGVAPFLSARDNALAGLRAQGRAVDDGAEQCLAEGARALDLSTAMAKRRDALSGGERRRVGLLRALVSRPALAIVDEPTSGLDPATADAAVATLATLAASGAAILAATHDIARFRAAGFSVMRVAGAGAAVRTLEAGA